MNEEIEALWKEVDNLIEKRKEKSALSKLYQIFQLSCESQDADNMALSISAIMYYRMELSDMTCQFSICELPHEFSLNTKDSFMNIMICELEDLALKSSIASS